MASIGALVLASQAGAAGGFGPSAGPVYGSGTGSTFGRSWLPVSRQPLSVGGYGRSGSRVISFYALGIGNTGLGGQAATAPPVTTATTTTAGTTSDTSAPSDGSALQAPAQAGGGGGPSSDTVSTQGNAGGGGGGNPGRSFGPSPYGGGPFDLKAYVPDSLLNEIRANPAGLYSVIVQSADDRSSTTVAADVQAAQSQEGGTGLGRVDSQFAAISGVSADLTGWQILRLASRPGILAITPDAPVESIAPTTAPATGDYQDAEMWRDSVDVTPLLQAAQPQAPVIAIVDSGIQQGRTDFADRLLGSVDMSTLSHGQIGDQEGHGTMVAGLAAGGDPAHLGAAPTARLIDVKTADANGKSLTHDVIRACDWILQNKDRYDIKVANFSLVSAPTSSFAVDPLNRAVEKLWLNGVVVVAAAGNYGQPGLPVDVSHAPGNDPFVITVGALDQNGTSSVGDDTAAPWSAFGQTVDGFSKPDLAVPGRYLIAPVPDGSYIPSVVPGRIVEPGYMWMSGTSLAAGIVSGAVAQILAWHPDWTPDQVKGALMETARPVPAAGLAAGVGEIDVTAAVSASGQSDPNTSLDPFVVTDPATGLRQVDKVAWLTSKDPGVLAGVTHGGGGKSPSAQGGGKGSASANAASWSSASWNSASWSSASWSSASWSSASWSSASWSSASWSSASWSSASWSSASWSSLIWLP